jgi:hypothetical protein
MAQAATVLLTVKKCEPFAAVTGLASARAVTMAIGYASWFARPRCPYNRSASRMAEASVDTAWTRYVIAMAPPLAGMPFWLVV